MFDLFVNNLFSHIFGMKKILFRWLAFLGILCMYVGVVLILDVTSPNLVDTHLSYIEKVKAQLYFFQDKDGNIQYSNPQLWTSSGFTQSWQTWDLTQVYINSVPINPDTVDPGAVSTVTNFFTPPPSGGGGGGGGRDSH